MDFLVSTSSDIFTTTFTPASKTITITGCNSVPLDANSISQLFDTTVSLPFNPANLQFTWYRSNGLPVYTWIYSVIPAGSAGTDVLNFLLSIPQNQSQFALQQKQATASAGVVGTFTGGETPTGIINGTNKVFTLAATPLQGNAVVILGGVLQNPQVTNNSQPFQYTISGTTLTFVNAPTTGTSLVVNYWH